MNDRLPETVETALRAAEERIFAAIRTRDTETLGVELADDFVHSSPGGPDQDRATFLRTIRDMPYRIQEIWGEGLRVRVLGETALLSGRQQARVALPDGKVVVAATAFLDVFARDGDEWRLRHAFSVEVPEEGQT